jgi:hypothetical protein
MAGERGGGARGRKAANQEQDFRKRLVLSKAEVK